MVTYITTTTTTTPTTRGLFSSDGDSTVLSHRQVNSRTGQPISQHYKVYLGLDLLPGKGGSFFCMVPI